MSEGTFSPELTELAALRNELATAKQRIRELEIDNGVLAKRAALAVTQEADALAPVFAAKMETQPCYRCDHPANKPDPDCPCCKDGHAPNADGHFTTATAEEFEAMKEKTQP